VVVTPSVPVKANSGVGARVPAAGKVLEGDDKPTLLREDQHFCVRTNIICIILRFMYNCTAKNTTVANMLLRARLG